MTPGIYKGKVTRMNWRQSQNNPNTLGLVLWVSIVDAVTGQEEEIPGTIWFSDKSVSMARSQLREVGFNPDTTHIREIGASVSLVGNEVDCIVEDDNKGKSRIQRFGKGGGITPAPSALDRIQASLEKAKDGDKAKSFDDLPEGFFDSNGEGKF